ncbi:MAG: beta-propeller fold lactonase family protein [Bacteroidota bacterium]
MENTCYACTETKTAFTGSISSFAIDSTKGAIRFIKKQPAADANPVYLVVDKSNRFIVSGNYTEGNAAIFSTNRDGSILPCLQSIRFTGSSINKYRQEKPHIHSVFFSRVRLCVFPRFRCRQNTCIPL